MVNADQPVSGVVDRALLLTGADVLWVRDALRQLARVARSNGAGVPERLARLVALSEHVACNLPPRPLEADLSPPTGVDLFETIEVDEAAALLGWTPRWVREHARRGFAGARKVRGCWVMNRADVIDALPRSVTGGSTTAS